MISNKQDFLKFIKGSGVSLFGAAPVDKTTQVKFAYTESVAKVGTQADGVLTFYADTTNNTGIVAIGDKIVSSKIFDVTAADKSGGKTGEKTITVTYFNFATKAVATTIFDVVDSVAAKAYIEDYFATSNTIDTSNGVANVRVDGATILVDSTKGLKTGLNIAYIAESGSTGATIALRDNSNNVLSSIEVSDIVGDGVLKDSIYHQDTNVLELRFGNGKVYDKDNPDTYTAVNVDLQKLIDINDVFIANDSSVYLHAELDASTVTLSTKMQDPSTADSTHTGLADALKVKQYVDSKTTDLAVSASGDDYVDASVDANDKKHINVAATDKTKAAVALAETALQGINKTETVNTYVDLTVGDKTIDGSTQSLEIVETALVQKFTDTDASIDNLQAKDIEIDSSISALKNKDTEIDSSIDRLDASVSAIETSIAAMDANLSENALNGSIGITLVEEDGKVTSIGISATEADTTFDETNITLTSTPGILTGAAIADIVSYVDAKSGALDSSVTDTDDGGFVTVKVEQENGALKRDTVTVVYGDYADPQADGIAKTSTTKTYVDTEIDAAINALDLANDVADASAVDAAGFVKTTISETDGIVKNESVAVTYGNYSTHTNGIAKTADTSVFVEEQIAAALTWTVLS